MLGFFGELGQVALDLFFLWMILEHGAAEFHLFIVAFTTVEEDLVKRDRVPQADHLAVGHARVAATLDEAVLFTAKFLDYNRSCGDVF